MASQLQRRIIRRVEALPSGLRHHIYRAQLVAQELACRHNVDEEKVALGTLAHDIARSMKADQLLQKALYMDISVSPIEQRLPILLHGPVGAETLRRVDNLEDDEIYQAVCWHTTAHANMTDVAKVVFLADKLDPQKEGRYPYLTQLKEIAMESLDQAILEFLNRELALLLESNSPVHFRSIEARNALLPLSTLA